MIAGKQNRAFFLLLLIPIYLFLKTNFVFGDALISGMKQVMGFVKFKGWETVKDYVVVQPVSLGNGDYCWKDRMSFRLLDDNDLCSFGNESHCSAYYPPRAIGRKYLSDIRLDQKQTPLSIETYSVSCQSDAYKNSYPTDTVIPHEFEGVKESNPLERKDYVVIFNGVDTIKGKLLMTVSAPILRYKNDMRAAKLFENSLTRINVINVSSSAAEVSAAPQVKENNVTPQTSEVSQSYKVVPVESPGIALGQIWKVASYVSTALISFIVGMVLGKKKYKAPNDGNTPSSK